MRDGQLVNQLAFKRCKAIAIPTSGFVDSVGSGATQPGVQQATESPDAWMVSAAGTLIVTDMAGVSTTLTVAASVVYYIRVQAFTGGTATGLIGLYY